MILQGQFKARTHVQHTPVVPRSGTNGAAYVPRSGTYAAAALCLRYVRYAGGWYAWPVRTVRRLRGVRVSTGAHVQHTRRRRAAALAPHVRSEESGRLRLGRRLALLGASKPREQRAQRRGSAMQQGVCRLGLRHHGSSRRRVERETVERVCEEGKTGRLGLNSELSETKRN